MAIVAGFDVQLERRLKTPWWLAVAVPAASIIVALLVGGVFLALTGHSPLDVYDAMLKAGYTTFFGITDTLMAATPLILTGLAAAFAMRMNLYNIGGEGQLYAGAITGSGAALLWGEGLSKPLAVALVFTAGAAGGILWMLIPALARAYLGTSEIITTLLFNYVGLALLQHLILGSQSYWRDPTTLNFPQGKMIPAATQFTRYGSTRVTVALIVALIAAVVVAIVWWYTSYGFSMKVIGDTEHAARYAGISVRRTVLITLLVSGALAGMAGAAEIGGRAYRLDPAGLAISLGYTGIIVAALARANPFGVVLVAILLGGLQNAGVSIQSLPGEKVPVAISEMLQGAILLFALGGEVFRRYRISITRVRSAPAAMADLPAEAPA